MSFPSLQWILRFILIILGTIIGLRFFSVLVYRFPGLFISLSLIMLGVLGFALYRGSLKAIGLKSRRAIGWSMVGTFIIFAISTAIFFLADR